MVDACRRHHHTEHLEEDRLGTVRAGMEVVASCLLVLVVASYREAASLVVETWLVAFAPSVHRAPLALVVLVVEELLASACP